MVILKYEIDTHKVAWWGITELRDVTAHISNAVDADNDEQAFIELKYAKEHIRRSALETMHEYASDIYYDLKPKLEGSTFKYRLLMLPPPDPKRVQQINEKVGSHLLEARMSRGIDWIKSVDSFYEAIQDLKELSAEFPSISEVRWRTFGIIFGILTIISSASAIYWLYSVVSPIVRSIFH